MTEAEELRAKNKAMRKFLIQETESNKQLQAELDSLRAESQDHKDQIDQLQLLNTRLVKRVEALQGQ